MNPLEPLTSFIGSLRGHCFMGLTSAFLMTSCSTQSTLEPPRFDSETGDMVVTQRAAVVYARDLPHISRAGRDYLYLGPVEVTRNGVQRYYLWVGTGSTLDRSFRGEALPEMSRLSLEVEGEVLDLPLVAWTSRVGEPYEVAAPLHDSQIAAVGFDDLERVLAEKITSIRLYDSADRQLSYTHWGGTWSAWAEEASEGVIGFQVEMR